jgi:hypothetical protein
MTKRQLNQRCIDCDMPAKACRTNSRPVIAERINAQMAKGLIENLVLVFIVSYDNDIINRVINVSLNYSIYSRQGTFGILKGL